MSGERYLLDTNAIVALLQGNSQLIQLLQNPDWIGISVISQIEFMAFTGLTEADRQLFEQFIQRQYSGQFFRGAWRKAIHRLDCGSKLSYSPHLWIASRGHRWLL